MSLDLDTVRAVGDAYAAGCRATRESLGVGRYLLFSGLHYPAGGWNDFQGSFATRAEAEARAWKLARDFDLGGEVHVWHHVVDLNTGKLTEDNAGE